MDIFLLILKWVVGIVLIPVAWYFIVSLTTRAIIETKEILKKKLNNKP